MGTADGLRPIEQLQPGDRVWAYSLAERVWSLTAIEETFTRDYEHDSILVHVAGEVIESTQSHPYWVVSGLGLDSRPLR